MPSQTKGKMVTLVSLVAFICLHIHTHTFTQKYLYIYQDLQIHKYAKDSSVPTTILPFNGMKSNTGSFNTEGLGFKLI